MTAEATALSHPTKASQHEFLATCIDVDVEKNVKFNNYQKYTNALMGSQPCLKKRMLTMTVIQSKNE